MKIDINHNLFIFNCMNGIVYSLVVIFLLINLYYPGIDLNFLKSLVCGLIGFKSSVKIILLLKFFELGEMDITEHSSVFMKILFLLDISFNIIITCLASYKINIIYIIVNVMYFYMLCFIVAVFKFLGF